MPLVEGGRIVVDRYLRIDDEAPIPDRVPVIVSARRFLAEADALTRRDGSLGVAWPNDRRVAELAPWLGHLTLVALDFPKFVFGVERPAEGESLMPAVMPRYAARSG